jgi:hypothetical protein
MSQDVAREFRAFPTIFRQWWQLRATSSRQNRHIKMKGRAHFYASPNSCAGSVAYPIAARRIDCQDGGYATRKGQETMREEPDQSEALWAAFPDPIPMPPMTKFQ